MTSPSSPSVQVTSVTEGSGSAAERAMAPPVVNVSSSGWACTSRSLRRAGGVTGRDPNGCLLADPAAEIWTASARGFRPALGTGEGSGGERSRPHRRTRVGGGGAHQQRHRLEERQGGHLRPQELLDGLAGEGGGRGVRSGQELVQQRLEGGR